MRIVLAGSLGLYIMAIMFDVIFMNTGFLWCKYVYWVALALATLGGAIYSFTHIMKTQKTKDKSADN